MILIDTDICIELLRGNKKVLAKSSTYEGIISISFMSVAELFYGALNSSDPEQNIFLVENFLLTVQVIDSDFNIMKRFGTIKAELKKSNNLLPDAENLLRKRLKRSKKSRKKKKRRQAPLH